MKTAVIYARYSSDKQNVQSIEGQLHVCEKYAKEHDILIVDTYIDRAMSGTNDNRAAFQKMIKDSAKRQWDLVLVYKLDRFSRNQYESVIHKKALKDNGVRLISAMENIPDSPEGNLMEALLEGFNQYFSEELAQKVRRGINESWRKGYCTGQRVYGYDVIDKKYVINEQEAAVVREVFIKYSQGFKVKTITQELLSRGTKKKSGSPIDGHYVYYMLHNIRYTGKVEHCGIVYDNMFPQIITEELWNKVKAITDENKHAPSRKKEIYDYILSGKLFCGKCKHRMSGMSGTSKTGAVHYYYVCSARHRKLNKCGMNAVHKQSIEDLVINVTTDMLNKNGTIEKIAEMLSALHRKEATDNTALKMLIKQRDAAVKASNNIIRAIEQGIITEMTKSRLQELAAEICRLELDISKEKNKTYDYLSPDKMEKYLRSMLTGDSKNMRVRKLLVNTFIREILLYDNKVIITYNFTEKPEKTDTTIKGLTKTEKQSANSPRTAFYSYASSYILWSGVPKQKAPLFRCFFTLALPRERTASVAPVRSYSELSSASVRSAEHFSGNANATELSGVFPLGVPDVNKYPRVETRGISLSLKRQSWWR